jgi:hypothetical protein
MRLRNQINHAIQLNTIAAHIGKRRRGSDIAALQMKGQERAVSQSPPTQICGR